MYLNLTIHYYYESKLYSQVSNARFMRVILTSKALTIIISIMKGKVYNSISPSVF